LEGNKAKRHLIAGTANTKTEGFEPLHIEEVPTVSSISVGRFSEVQKTTRKKESQARLL